MSAEHKNDIRARGPRVLVSYAHHEQAQVERTIDLARRLRERGIAIRMDVLDPQPDESWPLWMEREIALADRVLLVCTAPWASRFEGRRDAHGGDGVAWEGLLIRKHAYADRSTRRFIPVRFHDDLVEVPRLFAGQPTFVLERELDALVGHLAADVPLGAPRTTDAWPVLEAIDRSYAVVFEQVLETLATRVADALGTPSYPQDAGLARELGRAAVVIVLGEVTLLSLRRLSSARDRRVVLAGSSVSLAGALSVGADVDIIIAAAGQSLRELARVWWRRAGLDVCFGVALAGAGPLAATVASNAGARHAWLVGLGVALAGACCVLSGAAATAPDARLPALGTRTEWALGWRWLRGTGLAAFSPLRRAEVAGAAVSVLALISIALSAWIRTLPPLTPETMGAILFACTGSVVLGVVALGAGLRLTTGALLLSVALTLLAQSLSNLVVFWGNVRGAQGLDDLVELIPTLTNAPEAWLFAGPASAPWVLAASLLVMTGSLRVVPRRIALTPRRLRALGAVLASVASALAW